jgi:outer membrane protein OmpA-like peptidoglycan-associated protein
MESFVASRSARHLAACGVSLFFAALLVILVGTAFGHAQGVLTDAWHLDPKSSSITFQTVKKNTIVETSKFAIFDGTIDKDGTAKIDIKLESVDTGVDLRNVRMRFLFFETYKYPIATITAKLDMAQLADLKAKRRIPYDLKYTVSLHGIEKQMESPVIVTLVTDDSVSISSAAPIVVPVQDFNLQGGLEKLEDAVGGITIVPSGSLSFDVLFRSGTAADTEATVAAAASGALESAGNLSEEECKTRFDVLSRTGAIYFPSGSARLRAESGPLLATLLDIVNRCPNLKIQVAGHTDSDGGSAYNMGLSKRRAASVARYLTAKGVPADRFTTIGYGDTQPVAKNDTPEHKAKNRRIEFHIAGE